LSHNGAENSGKGLTIETVYALAPGESVGCSVTAGTTVRVANPKGHQVVDLWAFVESDPTEYLSMAHNRTAHYTTRFRAGHVLVSNRFKKLLRFVEDTTDGFHDSLHAACSAQSYAHFEVTSSIQTAKIICTKRFRMPASPFRLLRRHGIFLRNRSLTRMG